MIEKENSLTVGQKASISVFISLLIFSFLVLISQSGIFSHFENQVYSQVKIREAQDYVSAVSEDCENYVDKLVDSIVLNEDSYLRNRYVESYLKIDPSEYEIANRKKVTEALFSQFPALEGIRLIDDRQNIWFSTFNDTDLTDVEELRKQDNYLHFKNYETVAAEEALIPFSNLRVLNQKNLQYNLILDSIRQQFVVTVHFQPNSLAKNVGAIKAGTFVFYFSIDAFENLVFNDKILHIGDKLFPVSSGMDGNSDELLGFVILSSLENQQDIKDSVLNSWTKNKDSDDSDRFEMENLSQQRNGSFLVMLSAPSDGKSLRISGIFDSKDFAFSRELVGLIYLSLFISLLLVIFLIFSFRTDPSIVIKKRITRLQYEIINQYLENKTSVDWSIVAEQIESKRNSLSEDIKKSFGKRGVKYSEQIDSLLNKSWTEIINVMKSSTSNNDENHMMNEIKHMLEEILNNGNINYKSEKSSGVQQVNTKSEEQVGELLELYDEEELKDYRREDVDTVIPENVRYTTEDSSLEGDSSVKVEPLIKNDELSRIIYGEDDDDLADLLKEHTEETLHAEEVADELEDIGELEEIGEPENKDSESVEDIEELDEVEELEELGDADIADNEDSIQELDEAEDLEEIEEAEPEEEVDEIATLEEVDDFEVIHESAQLVNDMYEPTSSKTTQNVNRYESSDETYASQDQNDFPTVDNVFAEELCLGSEYTKKSYSSGKTLKFVVKNPVFGLKNDELLNNDDKIEELDVDTEDAAEQVKTEESEPAVETDGVESSENADDSEITAEEMMELNNSDYFLMSQFGEYPGTVSDISAPVSDAIVEKDGVFSISPELTFTDIIQDEAFKSLVDSVLK